MDFDELQPDARARADMVLWAEGTKMLRTLSPRVGQWHAEICGERESRFVRGRLAGRLRFADFTIADELKISLGSFALRDWIGYFAMAHQPLVARSRGNRQVELPAAVSVTTRCLWMAGGEPEEHHTYCLSVAFNNQAERKGWAKRSQALRCHCGLRPTMHEQGPSCDRHRRADSPRAQGAVHASQ